MSLFGKKRQPDAARPSEPSLANGVLMSMPEMQAHFSQLRFVAYDVDSGDYIVPPGSPKHVEYSRMLRELLTMPMVYSDPRATIDRLWKWFSRAHMHNLKKVNLILQDGSLVEINRLNDHAGHIAEYLSRGVLTQKDVVEVVTYVRGLFQL